MTEAPWTILRVLEATRDKGLWEAAQACPACDGEGTLRVGPASVWRSSGGKQGWRWYNGLITNIYSVRFPSGVQQHVVQSN